MSVDGAEIGAVFDALLYHIVSLMLRLISVQRQTVVEALKIQRFWMREPSL
jgi:hypothetical protein